MVRWSSRLSLTVVPLALGLALASASCTRTYERGEALYRQGDLRGALETWNALTPRDRSNAKIQGRVDVVRSELDRSFRLYEKRGRFYEDEARPAEALLYYRLALKLDPGHASLMGRVQALVRQLAARKREEREKLASALRAGELQAASKHAAALEQLDPFEPAVQIEVREVRAAFGAEVTRHLEAAKALYASGAHDSAAAEFQTVLALDDDNEEALGYLYYIRNLGSGAAADLEDAPEPAERTADSAPGSSLNPSAPRREVPRPEGGLITPQDILAQGHFRSAAQAEKAGDVYRAIQQFEAALRVKPSHTAARRRLDALRARLAPQIEELDERGKRFFRDEDVQNALVMWRRVLLIDPTREKTSRNVQDAEKILSRLEEIQGGG